MGDYPHTIDNGAGEKLTFIRHVTDPSGDYLEVENEVLPGSGPPMHVHYFQEEALTVVSGTIGYMVPGGEKKYAGPGETVTFRPGEAHRFWNAGDDLLRCTGYIKPPDNIEYFLSAIYDSTRENGGKRPHPIDGAFLVTHFKSEFGMTEIPPFVQKVIFPVQVVLGKLTGRLKKFSGAPKPRGR